MSRYTLSRIFTLFLLLALSGCFWGVKSIPQVELRAYRDALAQARAAGTEVLSLYAADVQANKAKQAEISSATPVNRSFEPQRVLQADREVDAVGVRLIALETMTAYTDLLVTLAEGKSVSQLQSSASSLITNLGTVGGIVAGAPIPGLSLGTSLLKTVLGTFEKARTREEFRMAVEQGEEVIIQILNFLQEDAKLYYQLAVTLFDPEYGPILTEISTPVGEIINIVKQHQALPDPDYLEKLKNELDSLLASSSYNDKFPAFKLESKGLERFSGAEKDQIRRLVNNIKTALEKEKALVFNLNAYYQLLETYVLLMEQTKNSLKSLRLALDQPLDIRAGFEKARRLAFRLEGEIKMYRDSIKNLKRR